jgi:hypothetical protein
LEDPWWSTVTATAHVGRRGAALAVVVGRSCCGGSTRTAVVVIRTEQLPMGWRPDGAAVVGDGTAVVVVSDGAA